METEKKSKVPSRKRIPRRVAVKFRDDVDLPYVDGAEKNLPKDLVRHWNTLAETYQEITLKCVYTDVSPERMQEMVDEAQKQDPDYQPPNFLTFFAIDVSSLERAEKLAASLSKWELVEYAYVESLPISPPLNAYLNPPTQNTVLPNTDLGGVDAMYAWGKPGGSGAGVRFIDIEKGWCLTHPDLRDAMGQQKITAPLAGINYGYDIPTKTYGETQHGTNVLGILAAKANPLNPGWKGIAYEATGAVVSPWQGARPFPQQPATWNVANAIMTAAGKLSFGDVLLLELQVEVQKFTGYWPAECEANNFSAIKLATSRGIVVVESAGNANCDFDAIPSPFNTNLNNNRFFGQDSRAIIVGAANPQSDQFVGTISGGRYSLSNYGARVNCFAWGDSVDTLSADPATGECTNNLGNPLAPNLIYTKIFGGTSAAAAIIAGAAIILQGIYQQPVAQGGKGRRFSAFEMRTKLSNPATGTRSANPTVDKIGVMPNLKSIINSP